MKKEKETEGALARWTKREQKVCDTSDTEIYMIIRERER